MAETEMKTSVAPTPSSAPSPQTNSPGFAFWTALTLGIIMLALVFIGFGFPVDWWTWLGVSMGLIPVVAAWRPHFISWCLAGTTFFYYLTFFFPLERHGLQDLHGGRSGFEIFPHRFRFGYVGPNTRLLEHRLGSLEAQWQERGTQFMLLSTWRDGDERVNCRNLIFSEELPAILEQLPTDEARQEVLTCLTDSTNLMRIHQGLLLTCLKELGYPPGMDAQTWWDKHSWVFQRERDPVRAVKITWGWTERLPENSNRIAITRQLRAVYYQERGIWGGDVAFGEAVINLQGARNVGNNNDLELGVNRIVWWP